MPMDFEWGDPPKRVVDNEEFDEVLDALFEAPGEWACVFTQGLETETTARNVRPRITEYAARRGYTLEAESRKVGGKIKVFARYVEPQTADKE